MKSNDTFSVHSIRKKILLASKVIGAVLIISYILSTKLPFSPNISLPIWTVFVVLLIFTVDFLMSSFISRPLAKLEQAATTLPALECSSSCDVMTHYDISSLSRYLTIMARNLIKSFLKFGCANICFE